LGKKRKISLGTKRAAKGGGDFELTGVDTTNGLWVVVRLGRKLLCLIKDQ
jgi:hypothetical protein